MVCPTPSRQRLEDEIRCTILANSLSSTLLNQGMAVGHAPFTDRPSMSDITCPEVRGGDVGEGRQGGLYSARCLEKWLRMRNVMRFQDSMPISCNKSDPYRSISGVCNNPFNNKWGMAGAP